MLLGYAGSDDSKVVGLYDSHTVHELLTWHRSEKGKDEDFSELGHQMQRPPSRNTWSVCMIIVVTRSSDFHDGE
jgi:hypothetical protein